MSKAPAKGPDAREAEAVRFCEENEPLMKEAGDITRTRIFTQGASLIELLSRDVKLSSDRTVAAADRLTEATKNSKISPKEIAAREATYKKELRIFKRREAVFIRLQALLDKAQIVREEIDVSEGLQVDDSDFSPEAVQRSAKKRSFLSRLFGKR